MNWENIQNATILNMSKKSFAGYIVSFCLKNKYKQLCTKYNIEYKFNAIPNHDAMIYIDNCNTKYVLESVSPKAKMTKIDDYLALSKAGKVNIINIEFKNITDEQRAKICEYWIQNINGKPYDYLSDIKIGLKLLWDRTKKCSKRLFLFQKQSILNEIEENSFYCTEGIQIAAKSQGFDIWETNYSTPVTTLERKLEGKLM